MLRAYVAALLAWSPFVRSRLRRLSGGTTIEVIYSNVLRDLPLPAPDVSEQRTRVAEFERDRAATEHGGALMRAHVALLEERKRALITAAVTGQFDVTTARAMA